MQVTTKHLPLAYLLSLAKREKRRNMSTATALPNTASPCNRDSMSGDTPANTSRYCRVLLFWKQCGKRRKNRRRKTEQKKDVRTCAFVCVCVHTCENKSVNRWFFKDPRIGNTNLPSPRHLLVIHLVSKRELLGKYCFRALLSLTSLRKSTCTRGM